MSHKSDQPKSRFCVVPNSSALQVAGHLIVSHPHNVRELKVPSVVHAEIRYFVEKRVLFSFIKTKRLVNWAVFSD